MPSNLLLVALAVAAVTAAERVVPAALLELLPRPIAYLLLAPGTIAHEMAHAVGAALTGQRVVRLRPFAPRRLPDGSTALGSMEFIAGNPAARSFAAIAPLLFVPLLIAAIVASAAVALGLPPSVDPLRVAAVMPAAGAAAFLLLLAMVARGAAPSRGDRIGVMGGALLAAPLVAVAAVADRFGWWPALDSAAGVVVTVAAPTAAADLCLLAAVAALRLFRRR
jgi:hypothetical protein